MAYVKKGPKELDIERKLEEFRSEANSEGSEIAVLGCAMVWDEGFKEVVATLCEEDFWNQNHRTIFSAISEVAKTGGESADPVAVATVLQSRAKLEALGGPHGLSAFVKSACVPSMVRWHGDQVREMSRWRNAVERIARAKDQYQSLDEVIDAIVSARKNSKSDVQKERLGTIAVDRLDTVETAFRAGDRLVGLPTGYSIFDFKTGGLQATDYVIVGGRPKVGKTALLLELAIRVATYGFPVLFVSQEMGKNQLADRLTASSANVSANAIRTGNIDNEILARLRESALNFGKLDFDVVDSRGMRVRDIYRIARDLPKRQGCVFIDYIQLLKPDDLKQPREQQVSSISRQIKASALETEIPWVVASQLKRLPEGTTRNPRPVLSDLRESGSIEQDADLISFVHREDYQKEVEGVHSDLEWIIAGNRHGSTGTIHLDFFRDIQRIENARGS